MTDGAPRPVALHAPDRATAQSTGLRQTLRSALVAPPPDRVLSPRVCQAISEQDKSSEILVKVIQLVVVAAWSVLYAVSPKTDVGTAFSPVPYALAGYLVLNVIGLAWALRRDVPNWVVYVSILLDVGVLMVLIWSFHIQYRQPPSFYLKAPTLLYIFIFIALRALRFQARFVIVTGVAAVIGWIALTLYVVLSDPSNNMITRDYVHYMTSNSVLLGAEVDKILSILLVTLIIALALRRANALLVQAVSGETATRDLSRFFDRSVAETIISADREVMVGQAERREAAILFVDIRGFTPMAATMDATAVLKLLTDYQRNIVDIVQRHGGTIDKFMGDGILATFGAAAPSTCFAADALRAVDAIIAETEGWPDQPDLACLEPDRVQMALAAGPVVFGTLGGENRLEFTTIGAAVNLAAKLEKLNKAVGSRVLTDETTWRMACDQGYEARTGAETIPSPEPALAARLVIVHRPGRQAA